jgi:predicted DNA-binding transcriptional regulator AlpA
MMAAPTVRASQAEMLSLRDTAKLLGMSTAQLNALVADEAAGFPPPYQFSPSRRGWRFFRFAEVSAWLERKRSERN